MALLTDFKCLRYSHIRRYIAAKHNSSDQHLSKMINQLNFMGKLKVSGRYVMLPGRKINANIIKAFDVMMDLTDGYTDFIYPGTIPFILMFSVKSKTDAANYSPFGVVIVEKYYENSICKYLDSIDRELTVIFILSDIEQQKLIKTKNKSYFAVEDDNRKYKFFKAAHNEL